MATWQLSAKKIMQQVHLFREEKLFSDWVTAIIPSTENQLTAVALGYDLLNWQLKATLISNDEVPDWAIDEIRLPVARSIATATWDKIANEFLCLFFFFSNDDATVLVAARNGAWKTIDDRFLSFRKTDFQEVEFEQAERLVNDKEKWSEMIAEVQMFGITCRLF